MTKPLEALTPEMARESANILIIVAARLVRRECLTPLHALSELNQKTISTRALRDAIDQVEESLLRESGKIRDGHDRLAWKLKETEAALEQTGNALLDAGKRIAELEEIRAAAEKLVRCKGRYHSELNYKALAAMFGVTTPDIEPEASQLAVKLPPHKYSECVNGLLEEAVTYAGTQQLRARLSNRLSDFVKPDHSSGDTVQGDE